MNFFFIYHLGGGRWGAELRELGARDRARVAISFVGIVNLLKSPSAAAFLHSSVLFNRTGLIGLSRNGRLFYL